MSYSVVILSGEIEKVIQCIDAVKQANPIPENRIIVVDDGRLAPVLDLPIPRGAIGERVRIVSGKYPFIFARNANIGIAAAGTDDVILLNDDALLETVGGFDHMQMCAEQVGALGVIGAACNNVGQLSQNWLRTGSIRYEKRMVCFVCVYLKRTMIKYLQEKAVDAGRLSEAYGLDERFVGYGFEDDDYCRRAREAGYLIGIDDGCLVNHDRLPSSFRSADPNQPNLFEVNKQIYIEKWGEHY